MSRRDTTSRELSDDNRLMISFVCLVGLSGGLMAIFGDASVPVVGLATIGGLVVGSCLLWYLRWILR
ncbi:hypothetical protein [Halostagnicola sp. A-GB9-2]|uniref:hypothetical protein n=1 Tax=Halostagnicola sp. A-GB9-2 TaxID=3048066 RepID=UPI0024BF2778|nr:hypothetical protein [Halostagnicola sp. A-GB9-2]MDJ1432051.1 hypothetical protein [Halostagnicola sp. A-GB9-2]